MKLRCKPNERCVIVAETPGCECNIGAEVTVTRLVPFVSPPAWEFKDASRPLKMLEAIGTLRSGRVICDPTRVSWARHTAGDPAGGSYCAAYDHHLVPIRPVGEEFSCLRKVDHPVEEPA